MEKCRDFDLKIFFTKISMVRSFEDENFAVFYFCGKIGM
jgi:hypothetical protein